MDKHHIRRAILTAVEDSAPGLATPDDIAAYPLLKMAAITQATLMTELMGLVGHGYLLNTRPGREPLLRLTAIGRDQLNQETDLDEYVWDTMASKFNAHSGV